MTYHLLYSYPYVVITRGWYELGQSSHCQSSGGLAVLCILTWLFYTMLIPIRPEGKKKKEEKKMLIMHRPTNGKPAHGLPAFFFHFFSFEWYDWWNYIRKHTKVVITFVKKKKQRQAFPFACTFIHTCSSNTTLQFQIELLKIERGIAETPLMFDVLVAIAWLYIIIVTVLPAELR